MSLLLFFTRDALGQIALRFLQFVEFLFSSSQSQIDILITRDALKRHTVSKNGSISFFFLRRSHKSVH